MIRQCKQTKKKKKKGTNINQGECWANAPNET